MESRMTGTPRGTGVWLAVIGVLVLAGCSTGSTQWDRIDPGAVEQPTGFMDVHHDSQGSLEVMCAPCHPAVDTSMTGVAAGPLGLVAVGWIFQGFHGAAWRSAGGSDWRLADPLPEKTVLSAVAGDASQYIAVGLDGRKGATAWRSTDGVVWSASSDPAFSVQPLRLTSIINIGPGFVVAGYEGTEFGSATAAFWTSADGQHWTRVANVSDFSDARPVSLTSGQFGLVAIGNAGPADHVGAPTVWRSQDGGLTWHRLAASPALTTGRMRSVVYVPAIGYVAVGENLQGSIGMVWTSIDGDHWTLAPSSPDLGSPDIQVRLYVVMPAGPGVVALGTATEGIQYGEAIALISGDGVTWTRRPREVATADAEFLAAAQWQDGLVVVGDRGIPDSYQATVWISPSAWK
jgi:hypothetical protein